MPHKAIGTILILLLMTGAVSAQTEKSGLPRPGLHIEDKTSSRTKEQREYDKALDREYRSELKKIPDAQKKSDPWGDIRPTPSAAAKNKQQ
jgi:hypothetical protein